MKIFSFVSLWASGEDFKFMNKLDLEKLINKPRAFRHHSMAVEIPSRLTMIFLGSEVVSNRETPRNYRKFIQQHKSRKFSI